MGKRGSPLSAKQLTNFGARSFCVVIGRYLLQTLRRETQLMIVNPPLVPPKRGFTMLLKIDPKL
jgi:hypothetical protein